jgi:hypothetical protein
LHFNELTEEADAVVDVVEGAEEDAVVEGMQQRIVLFIILFFLSTSSFFISAYFH